MPSSCNDRMYRLGAQGSSIRELFAYGCARKAQIGADKVFDFSIGNPSVPAPDQVRQAILAALDEPSLELHGYTPAAGAPSTRQAIAGSLNRRFGHSRTRRTTSTSPWGRPQPSTRASNAVCDPGDEVIVIAPFFPEYRVWIENAGCTCVVSPADGTTMMPDLDDLAARITGRTRAVIVDSPNNPTGAVYPAELLAGIADLLRGASAKNGRTIYLISDEPYREIAYSGVEVPWVPSIYENTLVCYSYSKSLSLTRGAHRLRPGARHHARLARGLRRRVRGRPRPGLRVRALDHPEGHRGLRRRAQRRELLREKPRGALRRAHRARLRVR